MATARALLAAGDRDLAAREINRAGGRVDALINDKVGPVRARVSQVQTQAQEQVAQQRARIDELQKNLEQRLRQLLGGVRLP